VAKINAAGLGTSRIPASEKETFKQRHKMIMNHERTRSGEPPLKTQINLEINIL
jgi:hypothetical protein